MNLTCADKNQIGLLGSMYFLGFGLSSAIVPRIADKFGRKKPYVISLTIQLIAYIMIYYSVNLNFTIALYLLVGL